MCAGAPSPKSDRASLRLLFLVVTVSLMARTVHFLAIAPTAFIELPLYATETDMFGYWQWSGQMIETGDWLQRETYHPHFAWMETLGDLNTWHEWWGSEKTYQQEPGYPYFLAVLRLGGLSLGSIILLQLFVGLAQPILTFVLANSFTDRRVATVAGLIAGLYGPLVFNQGALLRDWMGPLLATTVLCIMLRAHAGQGRWTWMAAGLVLGVSLWWQSTLLAFVPFALAWLIYSFRGETRRLLSALGMFVLGVLVGFSPLVIRNAIVGAPLARVTNRVPEGLITSWAPDANPVGMNVNSLLAPLMAESRGSGVGAMTAILRRYEADRGAMLGKLWLKVRGVLSPVEIPNNLSFEYGKLISPSLKFLPGFGVVWPLSVAGVASALIRRRDERDMLLIAYAAAAFIALMSTVILGRYRLLLLPVMSVFAAMGLVWTADALRAGRWRTVIATLIVLVMSGIGQHFWIGLRAPVSPTYSLAHPVCCHTSVRIYLERGQFDMAIGEAVRLYEAAKGTPHWHMVAAEGAEIETNARMLWGTQLWNAGDRGAAKDQFAHVAAVLRKWPSLGDPDARLGILFAELNAASDAVPRLQSYLQRQPEGELADAARQHLRRMQAKPM